MNDDKLIGLIARTLYGQNAIYDAQTGDGIPWDELLGYQECWQRDAEGLLTGLRAARYAIVELPEPECTNERETFGDYSLRVDGGQIVTDFGLGTEFRSVLSVETCRSFAAALLAAAEYAEKETK